MFPVEDLGNAVFDFPNKLKKVHAFFTGLRKDPMRLINEYSMFYGDVLEFLDEATDRVVEIYADIDKKLAFKKDREVILQNMLWYAFYLFGFDLVYASRIAKGDSPVFRNYCYYEGNARADFFRYDAVTNVIAHGANDETMPVCLLFEEFKVGMDRIRKELSVDRPERAVNEAKEVLVPVIQRMNEPWFVGAYLEYINKLAQYLEVPLHA